MMSGYDRIGWDEYFMNICKDISLRSTCKRAQYGAVVVRDNILISTGYNGAPRGFPHCLDVGCLKDQLNIPHGEGYEKCVSPSSKVETIKGIKLITQIKEGDSVLTHKNRYRKVTKVFRLKYDKQIFNHLFLQGRCVVSATPEHPLLVRKAGSDLDEWLPIGDIQAGDYIYTKSKECLKCGTAIPYWRKYCNYCFRFSAHSDALRKAASLRMKTSNPMKGIHTYDPTRAALHLSSKQKQLSHSKIAYLKLKELVPSLYEDGCKLIIVDHCKRPDILKIDFKNQKIIGIEYDDSLFVDTTKWDTTEEKEFYDDINWITPNATKPPFDESLFLLTKVNANKQVVHKDSTQRYVYNLEVEEDNSFVCQKTIMHNCRSVHAEQNALLQAGRESENGTIYMNGYPCKICAKLIINAGIRRVVMAGEAINRDGIDLLKEAGVEIVQL